MGLGVWGLRVWFSGYGFRALGFMVDRFRVSGLGGTHITPNLAGKGYSLGLRA